MIRRTLVFMIVPCLFLTHAVVSFAGSMKQGVEAYNQGDHQGALEKFTEAQVESPDDPGIQFNRSSALYQTENYEEAAKGFEAVAAESGDPALKEKAFYNLGNTAYRQGNLKAAADYYRKALTLEPNDLDAKQNLEFVFREIEKQKQEQQQQQNQDEKGKDQKGEGQDQGSSSDQDKGGQKNQQEQAQKDPDQPQEKGDKGSESSAASGEENKDEPEDLGQGKIQEAETQGEEREHGEEQAASPQGEPAQAMSIPPEEAERLLNSLSDDQRAFLRQQAERAATRSEAQRGVKDW